LQACKEKKKEKDVDLSNEEVVNPFQNGGIFKDISKNDRSNKNARKKSLKALLEENNVKNNI
jgi:hypothetical protein